jgi:hypothetical protein
MPAVDPPLSYGLEMKRHFFTSLLLMGFCFPGAAQLIPARLSISVVEGEGATTGLRQRVAKDPVILVEDDDHRPIAGAAVVFALPVSGASGEFVNGSKNYTVVTGADGLATAVGLKTNDSPGKLQIYVTASYRGMRARALINQTIEAPAGAKPRTAEVKSSHSSGKWKWVLLGVAAAGGAGAGIYSQQHNKNSTAAAPNTISITTGTVVFGSAR